MIKLYKDWRKKRVNTLNWRLDKKDHNKKDYDKKYLNNQKETKLTIKAFLLKKCP